MEELDGLLELADALCDDSKTSQATLGRNPASTTSAEQYGDDGEDLLLCLADNLADDTTTRTDAEQQHGSHNQQQSSKQQAAHGKPAASGRDPITIAAGAAPGSSKRAVSMTPTAAFSVVGKGSKMTPGGGSGKSAAGLGSNALAANVQGRSQGDTGSAAASAQQQSKQKQPECQHYIEKLTGLKLKLPRASGIVLKERYKHISYVPVSKARDYLPTGSQSWVVIGVLVSKSIGSTSQGAPYSRWKVSDLAGSDTWVGLFGEAHKDHYAQAEGSIVAFYNPRFSSKGPAGSSSSSSSGLAVAHAHQVEHLAASAGWGFCRGLTRAGARCSNAVDTTVSHYCQYHALQQAKTLKGPVKGAGKQHGTMAAAAGGGGGGGAAAHVPARDSGKVFDARKHAWSNTTSNNSSQPQQQQQPPAIKGNFSSSSGSCRFGNSSSSSGNSSLTAAGSGGALGVLGTKRMLLGDAAAAAAAHEVAARCAAEAARRKEAEQAELRETLRRKLLQQRRGSQEHQPCLSPPSSQEAPSQQQQRAGSSSAGAVFGAHCSANATITRTPQPGRPASSVRSSSEGFSLTAVVAAVDADKQRQQQEQHSQWLQPPRQLQDGAAAGTAEHNTTFDDAELDGLFDDSEGDEPDITKGNGGSGGVEESAAAAAAAAAAGSGSSGATAAAALSRLKAVSASGSSRSSASGGSSKAQQRLKADLGLGPSASGGSSKAQQRLKADLGLGPRTQKPGSKGSGVGAKAAAGRSSSSVQQKQHVSRIGAVAATGVQKPGQQQQQQLGGSRGCGAAAVASKPAGGAASDFRATFGRVLQRADINKPDAKLLAAAADEAHGSMFAKLLDQYEQKDQLAQQLEGITKLQVTAFECRTCKALTEKRRATCSSHDIIAVRVMKRWWLCEACGWKVTTLREVMPTQRCPKCRDPGVLFKPTSAYNAPKPMLVNAAAAANPMASRDAMLPRGIEHAFCLRDTL